MEGTGEGGEGGRAREMLGREGGGRKRERKEGGRRLCGKKGAGERKIVHPSSVFLLIQYLSNADERLRWQANSLPSDDLCAENAIMINRFNRYPLIIDPSGQATEFLLNEYKDRKITKTR